MSTGAVIILIIALIALARLAYDYHQRREEARMRDARDKVRRPVYPVHIEDDEEAHHASGVPERIRRLAKLRDEGLITPEEFETKKAELLRRM